MITVVSLSLVELKLFKWQIGLTVAANSASTVSTDTDTAIKKLSLSFCC